MARQRTPKTARPKLLQIIPAQPGWHAVTATGADGVIEMHPIACWGLYEITYSTGVETEVRGLTSSSLGGVGRVEAWENVIAIAPPGKGPQDFVLARETHYGPPTKTGASKSSSK